MCGRVDLLAAATAEEGFEIVRRRLFEPIAATSSKPRRYRAGVFRTFNHSQSAEFPPECRGADYWKRIRDGVPIHPEIFDQLYGAWSTLVKFQRTARRGLHSWRPVIHTLWKRATAAR